MKLEPTEAYYIRQLLRQNLDRLESVVVKGGAPPIDPLSDLNYGVAQLYLDDHETQAVLAELQRLAILHKSISHGTHLNRYRLPEIETQIFWLLGFKENKQEKQELVLVVDDQPTNLKLLEMFLSRQGYNITTASGGEQALAQAQSKNPDAILLDIWMPGMDGFAVCEQLKANSLTCDIPIIFVTSNALTQDKLRGFEMGGADYITRPFELEEVLARLEYQLKLRTLQKRLAAQNDLLQRKVQGRRSKAGKYRQFFEQAVDGMYQLSADGKYLEINLALATLYGYSSMKEMLLATQDGVTRLYVDGDRHHQFMTQIRKIGRVANFESQVYQANGNVIWIAESVRMARDDDDRYLYFEGTVRDITPYKS